MPSRDAERRTDGHRGTNEALRRAGMLLCCLVGGFALVGVAELVLRLPVSTFLMAGLFVGVGTWLPLAIRSRPLPDDRGAGGSR